MSRPIKTDDDAVYDLHAAGMSDGDVAARVGVSVDGVERARRRMSLPANHVRRRRTVTPLDTDGQALAMKTWADFGHKIRAAVCRAYPTLAVEAKRVLGEDGFEASCLRGLVIAASKFEPERGFKLITYALQYMRSETQRDIAVTCGRQHRGASLPVVSGLVEQLDGGPALPLVEAVAEAPADTTAETKELRAAVRRQIGDLPPRLRQVVMARFFFGVTLREIADRLGVSRERVRQLEVQALDHLRRRLGEGNA